MSLYGSILGALWKHSGAFMEHLWNIPYGHFLAFSTVIFLHFLCIYKRCRNSYFMALIRLETIFQTIYELIF